MTDQNIQARGKLVELTLIFPPNPPQKTASYHNDEPHLRTNGHRNERPSSGGRCFAPGLPVLNVLVGDHAIPLVTAGERMSAMRRFCGVACPEGPQDLNSQRVVICSAFAAAMYYNGSTVLASVFPTRSCDFTPRERPVNRFQP